MPITEQQRRDRRDYIGSSDVAAILGFDPFRTPHDVYLEKKYETEEASARTTSKAIEIGNKMEQALLDHAAEHAALDVKPNVRYIRDIFAANCDGVADEEGFGLVVVEAKTTSRSHEWGEDGTDDVPYRVTLQVQHQMYCSGAKRAYIPVLLTVGGRLDLRIYVVERDDELIEKMVRIVTEWHQAHVVQDVPPPEDPSLLIVQSILRDDVTGEVVDLEDALVEEYTRAREGEKDARAEVSRTKARLLAAMEDHRYGASEKYEVSYKEQTRKEYTVKENTYSVLRVRPLHKDDSGGAES